jgi:hypothetical protein
MTNALIIALFTVLRIGIPAIVLLSIGETVRRHSENKGKMRGA